jgi:hypothetical protein
MMHKRRGISLGKPTFKEGFTSGWILAIVLLGAFHTTTGWFKAIVALSLFVVYAMGFLFEMWRAFQGKSFLNPFRDGTVAGIVYFTGLVSFLLNGIGFK